MQGRVKLLLKKKQDRPSYTCGIDVSLTGTGLYFHRIGYNHSAERYEITSNAAHRDLHREFAIYDELVAHIAARASRIKLVCVEDYGPINRTSGKIAQRAEIIGMLKSFIVRDLGLDLVLVAPTALKKFATGNGNASKEAMRIAAHRYNLFDNSDNIADAAHLANLGACLLRGSVRDLVFEKYRGENKGAK